MGKISVVFFATPDIAINSFEYFINSDDFDVLALITQPPKPSNRGKKIIDRKIKTIALQNDIKVYEPEKISKSQEIIEELKNLTPDFFITFAFGQILSQEVIDIPKYATINLHASLLPKYRGANPICEAILNGETKTGITTMKTALELDAGDICLQEEIILNDEINTPELMEEISQKSATLLEKTLKGLKKGDIKPIEQEHSKATFTKKIKKEDKEIKWSEDAQKIHNKIRSMHTINTCHTKFNSKLVKILKTKTIECKDTGNCGEVVCVDKTGICVNCGKNSLLILSVKPEGKGEMSAYSWSLGSKIKKGDKFE